MECFGRIVGCGVVQYFSGDEYPHANRHFERSATQSRTRRLSEAKSVYIDLSISLRYSRDDDFSIKSFVLNAVKDLFLASFLPYKTFKGI